MGLLLIDQGITIVVEAAVAFDTYYIRTLFSTLVSGIWLAQLVGASPSKSFGFAFATAPMWLLFFTVLNESREILCELILRWNAFDYEYITCKDFIYQTNHKAALSWLLRKNYASTQLSKWSYLPYTVMRFSPCRREEFPQNATKWRFLDGTMC